MTICRPPRDDDAADLSVLRNDLPTQYALLAAPRPNSLCDVRAWLSRRASDPAGLFHVVADDEGNAVGFTQIVEIDVAARRGWFGIAIDPRHRGRGHGRAAVAHAIETARADGRMDVLMLEVATDNARAVKLYRTMGFREVEVLPRRYRAPDGWHDVSVMELRLDVAP